MENYFEFINTDKSPWHLAAYEYLLTMAKDKRKENISVIELSKKLDCKRSNIYRMESGSIDLKVSTLLHYLHGFGYHLEVVKDKSPAVDMILETDGLSIDIERFYNMNQKLDKKSRIRLLRYLLKLLEEDLGQEDGE